MEKFKRDVTTVGSQPQMIWSDGVRGTRMRSTTHGGFDNDVYTMNHILRQVLGARPDREFEKEDLESL